MTDSKLDCPFEDPKLNQGEVESVAALNSTVEEIAAYFDTTEEVIEEFYMRIVKRGWMKGKIKIRQLLMDRAEKDKDPDAIEFMMRHFLGDGGRR